jgi:hypothetical protein
MLLGYEKGSERNSWDGSIVRTWQAFDWEIDERVKEEDDWPLTTDNWPLFLNFPAVNSQSRVA